MKTTAFAVSIVVALALLLALVPVSRTYAADPTVYPGGLPWGQDTPWPVAMPLSVGQSWSAGVSSYSAPLYSAPPAPAPNPIVVAPPGPAPMVAPVPVAVVPAPQVVSVPAPVLSAPLSGITPLSALPVDGNLHSLGAGASVWHNIGTANGAGVHMDVTLDSTVSADGVDLSIFAPNQLDNLAKPVGRGTKSGAGANSQNWSGGGSYRVYGNWYARITNKTGVPIQYRITSDQLSIAPKTNCESYWESLLGHPVYWTACK